VACDTAEAGLFLIDKPRLAIRQEVRLKALPKAAQSPSYGAGQTPARRHHLETATTVIQWIRRFREQTAIKRHQPMDMALPRDELFRAFAGANRFVHVIASRSKRA